MRLVNIQVDIIRLIIRYADEKRCSLGYGERGIVMEEPGLREVIALACSAAIGSLLVYGYQKWIKKR